MNIGDIAEMAGVSRAAVSRYLNNGYISEEKKERIREAIEKTGYKPSVMAQTLRTKKTRLVGVILPRIHSDSISSIVEGIGTRLNAGGYDMLLATTENDPSRELDFLRIFSNHRVDGVILLATVITKEHRKLLREMKVPVVLVGQSLSGVSCIYCIYCIFFVFFAFLIRLYSGRHSGHQIPNIAGIRLFIFSI